MIFAVDIWLLPAIAAASSSYLVSLAWERFRFSSAPDGLVAGFLTALSFLMGAICSYIRERQYSAGLESNVIIMFIAGATTTYLWLLFRKHFRGLRDRSRRI
jgi:hypothetical protein